MWISSLVITLDDADENVGEGVIGALRSISAFTLGDCFGKRLPIVVEANPQDSRYWHDWIARLPGVASVEVAFVSFEDGDSKEKVT